jgi:dihydroorotase-like cyclic amidohydrolase
MPPASTYSRAVWTLIPTSTSACSEGRGVEDFYSGTSAAAGGVTTILDYALPEPGQTIQGNLEAWQKKAKGKAVIDYGFHPAIFEPTDKLIDEMADAVADGYPSFKMFMFGFARFDEQAGQYLKAIARAGNWER